jgi:anaerobic selenocysteine-containing dehydrogenase
MLNGDMMDKDNNQKTKRAVCGCCNSSSGCSVIVHFDDEGKISHLEPDNYAPLPFVCKIAKQAKDIVYNKNRIRYPLKRKGPKSSYDFERISWDEAYDIIVRKHFELKEKYGPESTAIYTGRGTFERSFCDIFQPKGVKVSSAASVLFPFGSPNTLGAGAFCYVSFAIIAPHVTMGSFMIDMFSDLENSDIIVVWGTNPETGSPPADYKRIMDAYKDGRKIIVIDPRRTSLGKLPESQWIPIRPGTDGALALSMCHVLINEKLYDQEFVEKWTVGFKEFAAYVQQFNPEYAEKITGIPAQTIRELVYDIVKVKGASTVMYTGLEYSDSGVQNIRATMIFWTLAGHLDTPGGRCFSMKENIFPINRKGHIENPAKEKLLGNNLFPLYTKYRDESHAILLPNSVLKGDPYKIRSLIIMGSSVCTSWPDPSIWKQTLNELDFLVCVDRQLTLDASYADIVLPVCTGFELESYCYYGSAIRLREKVIEPLGEARSDYFILAELAKRLGYGHLYPQTHEAVLAYALGNSGFTVEDLKANGGMLTVMQVPMQYKKWEKGLLREDGKPGFETPSGKFEIASSILKDHGYDALPVYVEPKEGPLADPLLAKEYPLVFNSGALIGSDFRTSFRSVPQFMKERPFPTVLMNPRDAKDRGIEHEDRVKVRTRHGETTVRAWVTEDITRGCVDVCTGGGGPLGTKEWQECNVQECTNLSHYDPISGFPIYKTLLCQVEKVK